MNIQEVSGPVPDVIPLDAEALDRFELERIEALVGNKGQNLAQELEGICFLPERVRRDNAGISVQEIQRRDGYSGYRIDLAPGSTGEILFAPLLYGSGFVIKRVIRTRSQNVTSFDTYNASGEQIGSSSTLGWTIQYVNLTSVDPGCPIVTHLYHVLADEYSKASEANASSERILLLQTVLRSLENKLSYKRGLKDPVFATFEKQFLKSANDRALNYDERTKQLHKILDERSTVIRTKSRVHRLGLRDYRLPLALKRMSLRNRGFWLLPVENLRGFLYRNTIGRVLWFLNTVRSNIGYSLALAVYNPFTFYFITQPINPHAMWAVGKIRTAYIDTMDTVRGAAAAVGIATASEVLPQENSQQQDSSTRGTLATSTAPMNLGQSFEGIHLSSAVPTVANQDWSERMSAFKELQIAYEGNLQISARMGRLEQMETQLNFALIAESAYRELDRYISTLDKARTALPKVAPAYFDAEVARSKQLQLYIWDKLVRYMLDHKYTVMDQSKEQKYVDSYLGRGFVFLEEITRDLERKYQGLPKPDGFKDLDKLSAFYKKKRVETAGLRERLAKNSLLHRQKDPYDAKELRTALARQWEILYLLENRAQEAANFGLKMYTWSVRNAIWVIESLHSAKRQELTLLMEGTTSPEKLQSARSEIESKIEPQYESLFHILTLEFVSVKPEMSEKLPNDIEMTQRRTIIDTIDGFFQDREKTLLAHLK